MRKILLVTLAASLIITMAGCLKDKGFENEEYGIQIKEVKAVAFPEVLGSPIVVGINSQATPQIIDGPLITLEQEGVAASDVKITLEINQALLPLADTNLVALLPTQFSINTLNVTIPAGERLSDILKITIPNSSLLDATTAYGIGLTIKSVDQGYIVAANLKDIVFAFNIKNQYDGKYSIKGKFYHPSYPYIPFATTVEMHTSGPNSVKMYWPAADDYANPWSTGSALTWFDLQDPDFTINPATNAVTVQNVSAGAVTFYVMGQGFDNLGYNSRYELTPVPPNTTPKTIYACYGYNAPGGVFAAGTTRMWIDTLVYTGPR